jgi:hypothetical protein
VLYPFELRARAFTQLSWRRWFVERRRVEPGLNPRVRCISWVTARPKYRTATAIIFAWIKIPNDAGFRRK